MSSRCLKKVTALHGNAMIELDCPNDDELSIDESKDTFSLSNKFSLLSNELSDSAEESPNALVEPEITQRKKPQKIKSKEKKKKPVDKFKDMTEDELMEAFNCVEIAPVVTEKSNNSTDALSLKIRSLNENIELQQLFGPPAEPAGPQNDRLRQRNQNPILKFTFGKRNVNWPNVSFSKLGLKMEPTENPHREGKWCLVTCSNDYLQVERALKTSMRTGNFQDHLRVYPYHVNTLLQMASMLVHQEDFSLAADLWKRIFYVYETIAPLGLSLIGSKSVGSLTKTNFSLDYRYRPNRGIFIALFQWIQYLCQKSCFNTALEYCKVLLSINTDYDPLAIVLLIDDIAIRCDQYDFLIKFHQQFATKKSLKYLPNYAFSMAICHFFKSSQSAKKPTDSDDELSLSSELLQEALSLFPTFVSRFIEHCNVKVDDRIRQSSFYTANDDPSSLDTLMELYSKRSLNFWKNPAVLVWLESNANCVAERFHEDREEMRRQRKHVVDMYQRQTPLAIKRHLLLSRLGQPLADTEATDLIFDPFPPVNGDGGFDHYLLHSDSEAQLDNSWVMNLIRSLAPGFGVV